MSAANANAWLQTCADVVEIFRKSASGDRDKVARAVREFLLDQGAFDVLGESDVAELQNVATAAALEAWLKRLNIPAARPWSQRDIDLTTLLGKYAPD